MVGVSDLGSVLAYVVWAVRRGPGCFSVDRMQQPRAVWLVGESVCSEFVSWFLSGGHWAFRGPTFGSPCGLPTTLLVKLDDLGRLIGSLVWTLESAPLKRRRIGGVKIKRQAARTRFG